MSGFIGGEGTKSGILQENDETLSCAVILSGNYLIKQNNGWWLPAANEMEPRHDPFGWWDDTNRKIIPKKRGIYQVYGNAFLSNGESGYLFGHMITYNGMEGNHTMHCFNFPSSTQDVVCQTIHQLQFDGVDDWVQITFHYNHASTERNVIGGIGMTEMGVIYLGEK
tara:strand:- start:417 stop:917 length:501 start_codon:yes stop_codon:yes gene_type:complete